MYNIKTMLAGAALLAIPALGSANGVNVDIQGGQGATYNGKAAAPLAGTVWNAFEFNDTMEALRDDQGNATDVSIWLEGNPGEWAYGNSNSLMEDYTYSNARWANNTGERFTLFSNTADGGSGLQINGDQAFDIYIYTMGDTAGQHATFQLNHSAGTTLKTATGDGPFDGTFTEGVNYVKFNGVKAKPYADGYEFEFFWGHDGSGVAVINGIQLVPVEAGGPTEETVDAAALSAVAPLLSVSSVTETGKVTWVTSIASQPWTKMPNPALKTSAEAPVLFVDPSRTYQTIDGFGGAFNELGWVALGKASESDAQQAIEALFGAEGCDFNLARIPIGASDFALDYYSLDDIPEDYELTAFSIDRDRKHLLPYVKAAMAVRPELQCWASPWTPPEWMKDNNFYSAGSLRWEPTILETYANYFIRWIEAYRGEGVNIYAVTPQNEPNIPNPYTTCIWTGAQLAEFIGDYLGPALEQYDNDVELWLGINGDPPHDGHNINDRVKTVMDDSKASSYLTGIGFQYDSANQIAVAHELYPNKKLMQTESVCFNGDNSWGQAMELYRLMQRYIDGGANAYFAWNMVLNETGNSSWNWRQNALITVNQRSGKVTYNGEYYVYKHFSHFVKPGAKRILSTGWWGDKIAFKNLDGSIVVIVANSSGDDFDTSIAFGGVDGKDTIKVQIPAHSVNTFVVPPEA